MSTQQEQPIIAQELRLIRMKHRHQVKAQFYFICTQKKKRKKRKRENLESLRYTLRNILGLENIFECVCVRC